MMAMFVNGSKRNEHTHRGPSIDASYHVSVHLANQKQELPVAAMFVNGSGQNQQSSYQVSFHLTKRFQRKRFLEIDQLETRIACDSHIY
jgi:hypothetical protein